MYETFVDNELNKKDKNLWVISVKRGYGLDCRATNLKLIHVSERMLNALKAERTILPAYKTTEERKKEGIEKMRRKNWIVIKQYNVKEKLIRTYSSPNRLLKKTAFMK